MVDDVLYSGEEILLALSCKRIRSKWLSTLWVVLFIGSLQGWIAFAHGQTQNSAPPATTPPGSSLSFEVASIKLSSSLSSKGNFRIGGHQIYIDNESLNDLICFAYEVHPSQVLNGPAWIGTRKYDIVAEADMSQPPDLPQIRGLLKSMLSDRFGLRLHHEQKQLKVYALVLAKGGPKLEKSTSAPSAPPTQTGSRGERSQTRTFRNNTMVDFAYGMQNYLERPVVDHTGIAGRYDFVLEWSDNAGGEDANTAPDVFTAVQEQLGLKFQPTTGLADVMIVDAVKDPPGN